MSDKLDYSSMSTEELLRLEKETKFEYELYNNLQLAEKILLNSLYGATGAAGFRYYDTKISASITTNGQLAIRWIERKLNELIYRELGELKHEYSPRDLRAAFYDTHELKDRVVLIDTDSVVLHLEDLVNARCPKEWSREQKLDWLDKYGEEVIQPVIESSYQELADYMNVYSQKLRMKRENVVDKMLSVARKSYFMSVYDSEGTHYGLEHPKHKIMGIRVVKSDVSKVVRDKGKEILPILVHGTEAEFQQKIKEFHDEFMNLPIEAIAFPKSVNNVHAFNIDTVKSEIRRMETNAQKTYNSNLKIARIHLDSNKEYRAAMNKLDTESALYVKGTPVHVKAALIHNKLIDEHGLNQYRAKISDGDKMKYVILKKQNPIKEEVVGFQDTWPSEFELDKYIDRESMFEKSFLKLVGDLGKIVNWETKPTQTLAFLFG